MKRTLLEFISYSEPQQSSVQPAASAVDDRRSTSCDETDVGCAESNMVFDSEDDEYPAFILLDSEATTAGQ